MRTRTLTVPGAILTYDVGDDRSAGAVPLVLVGSPMDASGFASLSAYFDDRLLVTVDPRNSGRSVQVEPTSAVSPQQHADDLHAVLCALDAGPVDMFASSGGAVNALTLVSQHPTDVRLLVAHEPPAGATLPDHATVRAVCEDIVATYTNSGLGPAMAKFITLVTQRGQIGSDYLSRTVPDPAAFGLSSDDDGTRTDPMMSNLRGGVAEYVPDVDALMSASTEIVIGVGEDSGGAVDGEIAGRAAYAIAALLGREAVVFPSGHSGFLGGEFGQTGKPAEFAAKLRILLG